MPVAAGVLGLEAPETRILLSEEIQNIRSILGPNTPEDDIIRSLTVAGNNPNRAINILLDMPGLPIASNPVKQEMAPEVLTENDTVSSLDSKNSIKKELGSGNDDVLMSEVRVKKEELDLDATKYDILMNERIVKKEESDTDVDKKAVILVEKEESDKDFKKDEISVDERKVTKEESDEDFKKDEISVDERKVTKEESDEDFKKEEILMNERRIKKEEPDFSFERSVIPMAKKESFGDDFPGLAQTHFSPYLNPRPISAIRPASVTNHRLQVVPAPDPAEIGEFPEEPDWFLVGKTYVTGLSTCRGRRRLDAGEIVHFSFPDTQKMIERHWGVSAKTRAAMSEIVRFSTKRCGEIGKLPTEWSRCLIPLVNSSKVKVQGRFVIPQVEVHLMQEIILYVSFYIHSSIFMEGDKSSWKLVAPSHLDSTVHPLPAMFKLLKIKPFKKAEFTPEELDTRKRSLNLKDDDDGPTQMVGLAKRRRGGQTYPEQSKDEQAISESALNKLVGAADVYNLEEAEPPSTLVTELWPYQKQALYWLSELEKGIDVEQAAKTLHPCWEAYKIADKRASAVYINVFSGEATTQFPSATQMARGGILADAMGLGKTVMTIALILAKPNGESSDDQDTAMECNKVSEEEIKRVAKTKTPSNVKGGTLIVCPMALLGQWKDELEAHSKSGALSVFVHYGGDKTNDPKVIAEHHVVLTTYGVLAAAYKSDSEKSIFHKTDWYRVVLDEAHIIKSSKTRVAQSAFALTSHCRWCLTGTPLQNNLEDLYSLLCFLHVEPWCNWAWWHKLIQRPYENGDERGLRLVKSILRPLMLRRTKDTKDKDGRPILVLPPANIQLVECEQSEAERDFYDALFKKSKVRFDQFVAQGKVLHNYASILELLLRLRQCCNHPFLVMSRGDTQQYADLNKLAHHFLEGTNSTPSAVPTRAFVEEVVEGIRRGDVTECPICLESASDDPVLTPCAHRMCRECLLSSWWTPSGGPCPICRNPLTRADLITCPTESRFQVDVERNWKESSKIMKLLQCLESIRKTGEKSIIFSQWTGFLDLLEIPLRRRRIGFLRFDGKLAQKSRERVLKEFSDSRDKLVLLMSLKAGGVGLNLTAASNVFLMDPWWNPAVEEQAIMRIHRIGQKRQVQVRRFIVKDTVEERMQQVQARKQRMIAGALTDEEVRSARIEELKMLFR